MVTAIINDRRVGRLDFLSPDSEYVFQYEDSAKDPVSLAMPNSKRLYHRKNHIHPFFEMYLPEGYLFEIFKNLLLKEYGGIDDYRLFSLLAPNINGRVTFESDKGRQLFNDVQIEHVLDNDTEDTFMFLMRTFLHKNAISGVQPKTFASLIDRRGLVKEQFSTREYIVKTWGVEFPRLAENEYFCMKAVKRAGVAIPDLLLSKNCRFLLVERFDFNKEINSYEGFEEVLGLMGKNRNGKYTGSYEQVARLVYSAVTDKLAAMQSFYRLIVMNYLLGNGDGHLKNFGLIYDRDIRNVRFAPAYDVVSTIPYVFNDKPALSLGGKKLWYGQKDLIRFGQKACQLSEYEAVEAYKICQEAVVETITELEEYIKVKPDFKEIGAKMTALWQLLLRGKTYKEIPVDTLRPWRNNS